MRIRRACADDLARILKLERASFGRQAWPRELFEGYRLTCRQLFLVAERGPDLLAYIIVCRRRCQSELVSIAVSPGARRTGVGRALVRLVIGKLRAAGVRRLHLAVKADNKGAIRFYETLGFRRSRFERGYYEDGHDAWRMIRRISGA